MDKRSRTGGLSIETGVFMDKSVKIGTLSMKSGFFMDGNGKHVRLSLKSGGFVDKFGENSGLSIETGVFMDKCSVLCHLSMKMGFSVDEIPDQARDDRSDVLTGVASRYGRPRPAIPTPSSVPRPGWCAFGAEPGGVLMPLSQLSQQAKPRCIR